MRCSGSKLAQRFVPTSFNDFIKITKVGKVEIPKKSSCRRVLGKPFPCGANAERIAQHAMCMAFYSPTRLSGNELLVEHFRKNVREAWANYRQQCQVNSRKKWR